MDGIGQGWSSAATILQSPRWRRRLSIRWRHLLPLRPLSYIYAGGADATVLRALLRKSALEKWSVASLDVKTAFLLAPRRDAQQRLLITRPPRVLVEAKVCAADEIWEVRNSLYGLQEAPLNWARFRDEEMAKFRWTDEGECWKLARAQEPNLWKVILDDPSKSQLLDKVYGFVAVYVDDILVTGDEKR